jgi:hypothetical protein
MLSSRLLLSRSCCIRWRMGYEFLTNTSVGVFQYVFLRLAATTITLVTEYFDLYNDVSVGALAMS